MSNFFNNRYFSERNKLIFEYPSEDGETTTVFLPFYENPTITETQSANYAEYNPIGRAGALYAYTGASSRKFKLSFNMTLPHLAQHPMGISRFIRVYSGSSKESQQLLFTKDAKFSSKPLPGDPNKSLSLAVEKAFVRLQLDDDNFDGPFGVDLNAAFLNTLSLTDRNRVLDTLLFFVALLRTSVVNKATNPLLGPPLIRIDFGTMYQQVPCVCKSYNISYDEAGGYDLETTTPRVVKISLNLEEIRTGDFSTYDPAVFTKRDNLTGWESAINSPHTTDPLAAGGFWKGSN
jgi:hypothetical protein